MPVVVYTKTTCAPCRTLKTWLKSKNIQYVERVVDIDPSAIEEMIANTGMMSVPQTVIGDQVVSGPNFALLTKLLTH